MSKPRTRTWLKRFALASLALIVLGGGALFIGAAMVLRASLPRDSGEAVIAGLSAPAMVDRDRLGVVRIRGENFEDTARALGFVHAQDRFFQMDLMRRRAAGELSEMVGAATLDLDRSMRVHRFRHRAAIAFERMPDRHKALLEAYADGVNAGVADLRALPPEHLVLRARPAPWTPEDSLLVAYVMFDMLAGSEASDRRLGVMRAALPEELVDFLTPDTTRFDAPLIASANPHDYSPAPIPGPDIIDLRTIPEDNGADVQPDETPIDSLRGDLTFLPIPNPTGDIALGSNNWAVAGSRTPDGRAILANDMHLGITVPPVWHRAQLEWGDRFVAGVTLPGLPGVIVGANGHVAWGLTNTFIDVMDLVRIRVDPDNPDHYLTPDGPEPFTLHEETIRLQGGATETLTIRETRWGPVIDDDYLGAPLAMRWTAHDPEGFDIGLLDMMTAETIEDAVRIAADWRGPPQNVVIADDTGRIAWTVSGLIPIRNGVSGAAPEYWSEPDAGGEPVGWIGWLDESRRPAIIDPESGAIFTANNRTLPPLDALPLSTQWPIGTRASRIRDTLLASNAHTEADMLALQLDTRVELYDEYRDILLETIPVDDPEPLLIRLRELVEAWPGRADAADPGHRLLRDFRRTLHTELFSALTRACIELDPNFSFSWFGAEEPLRRILEERPDHMLPHGHESWPEFLRSLALDMAESIHQREGALDRPWGEANPARVRHPLSLAIPAAGRWLDMPETPQHGDIHAVRVATPGFGASQRMAVSPGREEEGILHIPAGQSGHFLSRHYSSSHADWLKGAPSGLLVNENVTSFRLTPAP
ncbi:MAG: penicillin acylase family protein [Phycisphaeraceae bacterium]|nr:MAG: penicillin acylase family protein [Phycisphaeraceae bacterium]